MSTESILRDIAESDGVVIRGFRSRDHLRACMQQAIDDGKKCAFVPSLKTLRVFLNTSGFVAVMTDVNAELRSHQVIIEPGVYDSTHLFAIGPALQLEAPRQST